MELFSLTVIYLGPDYGGGNEDNDNLLLKVPYMYCYTQCPQPCSRPPWTHGSAGDSWKFPGKSGSVSCGGHCSFPLGPGEHRVFLCPLRVYFPVLCMFWQLYGEVNGDLFQEGLCHTQVSCSQSPCPCGSPLLICTSKGETQTQFCLRLCGVWVLAHTSFV